MKSSIVNIFILGLIGMLIGTGAVGGSTTTVSCSVSVTSVSLSLSDGGVDYGILGLNATTSTVDLGGETQVITNDGNVTEDFNVISSDAVGTTTWELAGAAASDAFEHKCASSSTSTWTDFNSDNTSYIALYTSIASSSTSSLDLLINTPTATDDYEAHTITVTVQASES